MSFFRYFLLLSTLLPISLFVNLEMIKITQSMQVGWDYKIFSKDRGKPAFVSNSSLIEEIGQVNYVFTDKTGTLTRNEMVMKAMAIGSKTYGNLAPET